ncbi:MAG TPA: hypothetical protein VF294_12090 [Polyangiaceae bacterium]
MSSRRQRELCRIQRELEAFYGLERAPNVTRFVRDGDLGSREVVLVRESETELEMALVLPPESKRIAVGGALNDVWLQVAEGVSHFIYLAERARVSLPVTKLELVLQANAAHNSNRQVVRLYERWVKTGSAPLAVALAGKGLTPQRGHGGLH